MFNILYDTLQKKLNKFLFFLVFMSSMFFLNILTIDLSFIKIHKYIVLINNNYDKLITINVFIIKLIGLFNIFYFIKFNIIFYLYKVNKLFNIDNYDINKFDKFHEKHNLTLIVDWLHFLIKYELLFLVLSYLGYKTNIISINIPYIDNVNIYKNILHYLLNYNFVQILLLICGISSILNFLFQTHIKDILK